MINPVARQPYPILRNAPGIHHQWVAGLNVTRLLERTESIVLRVTAKIST